MGVRSWLGRVVSKTLLENLGRDWTSSVQLFGSRSGEWQDASSLWESFSISQKERALRDCIPLFACIRAIANAAQESPIMVGVENEDGLFEADNYHPVARTLNNPNPVMSRTDLIQYMTAHLHISGKTFLWEWRNRLGELAELWPVPPSWVEIVPLKAMGTTGDERMIDHYIIQIPGGDRWPVPHEDMVHIKWHDPFSWSGTLSPLQVLMKDVQLDAKSQDYWIEKTGNTKPTTVVKTKSMLTDDQSETLRAKLRQRLGYGEGSRALILSGEDAAVEVLDAIAGIDWHYFSAQRESRICAAFRVPPVAAGLQVGLENSPWSNISEAKRWMYSNNILPFWDMLAVGLTRSLLRQEGDEVSEVRFRTDEIKELQEDVNERAERIGTALMRGGATRSEYREALGLETNDTDDVFYMPVGTVAVPRGQETFSPPPPPPASRHEEDWEGPGGEEE